MFNKQLNSYSCQLWIANNSGLFKFHLHYSGAISQYFVPKYVLQNNINLFKY